MFVGHWDLTTDVLHNLKKRQKNTVFALFSKYHVYLERNRHMTLWSHHVTVHTVWILHFPLDQSGQILSCTDNRGGQLWRPLSPPQDRQQGAVAKVHGGRLSYGCIYMVFFMILSCTNCPLNAATESGCPDSWKIAGSGGLC